MGNHIENLVQIVHETVDHRFAGDIILRQDANAQTAASTDKPLLLRIATRGLVTDQ